MPNIRPTTVSRAAKLTRREHGSSDLPLASMLRGACKRLTGKTQHVRHFIADVKHVVFDNALFIVCSMIASLAYAILRFKLNIEYSGATWKQLFDLAAPIPFGYRILVPILSKPLVYCGATIQQAYQFWETIFCFLLILSMYCALRIYTSKRRAASFALFFLFVLPLAFLLRFEYPIYYPHDTPAMAAIAIGSYLVLSKRWTLLWLLMIIATLNRESSIIIIGLFVVSHFRNMSRYHYRALAAVVVAYGTTRCAVYLITLNNPKPYGGSMAFHMLDGSWRIINNLSWLTGNGLTLLSTMAFLPVAPVILRQYIPQEMRHWHLIAFAYLSMLAFIGNLYEPRIFGEILVVLFIPSVLGLLTYLDSDNQPHHQ